MAEEKHRMLYQGQDPSQPVQRPLSLAPRSSSISSSDSVGNIENAEPQQQQQQQQQQQPPTYDDAVGNTASLRHTNRVHRTPTQTDCGPRQPNNVDRRCTFFAEPQHLRSQLELEPYVLDVQPAEEERSATETTELPTVEAVPQPHSMLVEHVRMPQVRSFFALAPQPKLGGKACAIVCPACGQHGRTRLRRTPNTRTHCWALWLCSFGWCCCACLYPYLMDSCRTTSHYCTLCKTFLGAHYPKECCL